MLNFNKIYLISVTLSKYNFNYNFYLASNLIRLVKALKTNL